MRVAQQRPRHSNTEFQLHVFHMDVILLFRQMSVVSLSWKLCMRYYGASAATQHRSGQAKCRTCTIKRVLRPSIAEVSVGSVSSCRGRGTAIPISVACIYLSHVGHSATLPYIGRVLRSEVVPCLTISKGLAGMHVVPQRPRHSNTPVKVHIAHTELTYIHTVAFVAV
jgi:hypothetical protein